MHCSQFFLSLELKVNIQSLLNRTTTRSSYLAVPKHNSHIHYGIANGAKPTQTKSTEYTKTKTQAIQEPRSLSILRSGYSLHHKSVRVARYTTP
jgi:hypothetical protein